MSKQSGMKHMRESDWSDMNRVRQRKITLINVNVRCCVMRLQGPFIHPKELPVRGCKKCS